MFCPHCGKEIPDNSTYCMVCGKSPSAAIKPQPVQREEPKEESHTFRNIVILVVAALAIWIGVKALSNSPSGIPGVTTRSEPLTPESFPVPAGQIQYYTFTLTGSGRVVGKFEATGGSGNDISVVITDTDNFENWKNGHQARVNYQSGKITVGNINTTLGPGTYYLAFSNAFSAFTAKNITSNIALIH